MEEPWYSYWPRPYKVRRDGKKGNDVDINSPSVDLELMTIVYCVSFIEDSGLLLNNNHPFGLDISKLSLQCLIFIK